MGDIMIRTGEMPDDTEMKSKTGANFEGFVRTVLTVVYEVQGLRCAELQRDHLVDIDDLKSEELFATVMAELEERLTPEQAFAVRHPEARRIDQMSGDAIFAAISASARQAADVTRSRGKKPVYKTED